VQKMVAFIGSSALAAGAIAFGSTPASAANEASQDLLSVHDDDDAGHVDYLIAPIDQSPILAATSLLNPARNLDPTMAPKPQGKVKVTVFNLLDPQQAPGSGMPESLANSIMVNTNTWLRDQGVSESSLDLTLAKFETIQMSAKLPNCDPDSGLIDVPQAMINEAMTTGTQYDTALIVSTANGSFANCASAGMAYIGRPLMILTSRGNATDVEWVFRHELGHNLGLFHAGGVLVKSESDLGRSLTFPLRAPVVDAAYSQYGDPVSIMGNGRALTNTEKVSIGFNVAPSLIETATTKTTNYTLRNANSTGGSEPVTLIVKDAGRPMYSVEYRSGAISRVGTGVPTGVQIKTLGAAPYGGQTGMTNPYSLTAAGRFGSLAWSANAGTVVCWFSSSFSNPSCNKPIFPAGKTVTFPNGAQMTVTATNNLEATVSFNWSEVTAPVDNKAPVMVNQKSFQTYLKRTINSLEGTVKNSRVHRKVKSGKIVRVEVLSPYFTDNTQLKVAQIRVNGSTPKNAKWEPTRVTREIFPSKAVYLNLREGKKNYVSVIVVDSSGNRFVKHWVIRLPR